MCEQGSGITRYDFFNLLYVTNDFKTYPYLSRDNISLLFLPVIFYILGIIIAAGDFLLKSRKYFSFYYGRVQKKSEAIKLIKGHGVSYSGFYVLFFSIVVYAGSFFCIPERAASLNMPEYRLLFILILHGIGQWMALLLIREIMFYIYCKAGVSASFSAGFLFFLIILLLDMQLDYCNLLLFMPKNYFADSTIIMALSYKVIQSINNKSKYVDLPY